MLKQYFRIKEAYRDAILLFRLGDFYEMFDEDAKVASRVLNIALTSRNNLPMCGVPYHAADTYIRRLLEAGFKVAICEQTEDPSQAKGIVRREVVRVITPGTYLEAEEGASEEYVVSVLSQGKMVGVAAANVAIGSLLVYQGDPKEVESFLSKLEVGTLVKPQGERFSLEGAFCEECESWIYEEELARRVVKEHFGAEPEGLGLSGRELALRALGALLYYLKEVQFAPVHHLRKVEFYLPQGRAFLDPDTIRHLELVGNLRDGSKRDTLLEVLDFTQTPMGYRKLREALLNPLYDREAIKRRLDAVEELLERDLSLYLKGVGDLLRVVSRIEGMLAKPKELVSLKNTLLRVPHIKGMLEGCESVLLNEIKDKLFELDDVVVLIERAIEDDPDSPYLIKRGYNGELDTLKDLKENSHQWIKSYEEKEKIRTGIPSLKVGYNKVFGYYIEVTKTHLAKVPPDYVRKQTLVNAERFITEELKEVEERIANAQVRIEELERDLYRGVLKQVSSYADRLRETADALGYLDFLNSLACAARHRRYVKPKLAGTGEIVIKNGRHPVVESILKEEFVPNDTVIKPGEVHIITGPNMSGKSTYIRQVALIVLMAQIGSFVPVKHAVITPVDRIMTRIGTADNLAGGQSTFMVEMTETANILNNATEKSLVVLDEVGRGTSTYDGLAIAWATVEYIAKKIKAKTLFATHYHELTQLAHKVSEVKNYRVDVREWKDRVIFTHKVVPGGADKSYGIYVAQIAGLPEEVVERAKKVLDDLERERGRTSLPLYEHPVLVRLRHLNIDKISPLEALMLLEELKGLAEGFDEKGNSGC